jgi:RNA polymerase sigma factor (sigma-70 family)
MIDDDAHLLLRYAADRSEAAFAEVVRRHIDFVYSAALRQANGDAHLAQDATQQVFTDLARKAASLADRPVLTGWLFVSTRFAVSKLVRSEQRRRAREQEAHRMNEIQSDPVGKQEWERVRPALDEALAGLNEADREAVLLRFFGNSDFAGIGAKLRLSENAARMRVDRALDKLHAQLARRGVTSSTAALAAVLANQAVAAAPAGLAATVTGTALTGGASAGAVATALTFMTMNKLIVGAAGMLVAVGFTGFVVQGRTTTELRTELQGLQRENQHMAALKAENLRLAEAAAELTAWRTDGGELDSLNQEADALKARMMAANRAMQAKESHRVYDISALDGMPRPTREVTPQFPAELKRLGRSGEVTVDFVVDQNGTVRNAYAAKSTLPELEAAAVAAVSQWSFDPGRKGGRAVSTHLQVPIVFANASGDVTPGPVTPVGGAKIP